MALLQIILAIALVVIFFIVGFAIYNMEFINSIRQKGVVKVETPIFSGVKDLFNIQDEIYNTTDISNGSYRAIVPSYNQSAGVEFSYNFWLYVDRDKVFTDSCTNSSELTGDTGFKETTMNTAANTTGNNGAPIILFLKGDKELVTYKNVCNVNKVDVMVKCPLVKLEQCGNYLTVEFNTIQSHEAISENSPNICSPTNPNWTMANAHKLTLPGLKDKLEFDKKWCMFTIVIQDTYPTDPYPIRNKVRCRIYVNGLLELDRYVDGTLNPVNNEYSASVLKLNDGNLHVAPKLTRTISDTVYSTYKPSVEKALMMANLTYYNYALVGGEVDALFDKKFSKTTAPVPGSGALDTDIYSIVTKPTQKQFNV